MRCHAGLMPQSLRATIGRKTIDLFSTLRHWNLRNLTLQQEYYLTSTRDFFPQYARLYNAAASPASRLRSAGLVGNYTSSFRPLASQTRLAEVANGIERVANSNAANSTGSETSVNRTETSTTHNEYRTV